MDLDTKQLINSRDKHFAASLMGPGAHEVIYTQMFTQSNSTFCFGLYRIKVPCRFFLIFFFTPNSIKKLFFLWVTRYMLLPIASH